ncbi:TonB-dependent siderophore receptor [Rubrivirga sp. IMCC43871]|uniref:TonB-dependent siderophore receptor n=1 Tax=Rubrivirga sp. IMCC43871 TaxID=3391575 RepID=UPI00398FEEEE
MPHLRSAVLLALLVVVPAAAQTGTLAGRVLDSETQQPLPGATVHLVGTTTGSSAGPSGRFTLAAVPVDTHTLRVSLIGYEAASLTVEVREGERVVLDVALSQQTSALGAITVVSRRGGFVPASLSSASKIGASPLETPQSVSVITQDQLEVQDATTLAEALRYTPGVQGEVWGYEPRFTWLTIRGFDATQTGLYRDGLQLRNVNYAVDYNVEPYGMERIEVLRGPASVLYGAGSPGGVVAFSSKRPTPVAQREATVETGSFGRVQAQADVSGPIDAAGRFAYRLTGLARSSGTQVEHLDNDRLFVAPALSWRPTDRTTWTVLGDLLLDDTGTSPALPIEARDAGGALADVPYGVYTGAPGVDRYDRDVWSASSLFEHRIGQAVTVRQNTRTYSAELDDLVVYTTGILDDGRSISRSAYGRLGALDGLALDNSVRVETGAGALGATLLAGLDVQRVDVDLATAYLFAAPTLDLLAPDYDQALSEVPTLGHDAYRQSQTGAYLQGQFDVAERLILSVNGRYDWATTEATNRLAEGEATSEQSDRAFTWRAGAIVKLPFGVAPYASYATSFLPQIGVAPDGAPFTPERGRQVEVGVKVQPPALNAFVTVALFDLVRQDFLQYDPATFAQVQTGEVASRGVEFEAVASLLNGLDVTAGLTLLDVEITESGNAAELGMRPTQLPETTGSLWANYTVQDGPLAGVGLGAGVRHVGSTFGNADNTLATPGATLADAAAFYAFGRFRFQLNVQNVLDEEYVAAAYDRATTLVTLGARRQISAGLSVRF